MLDHKAVHDAHVAQEVIDSSLKGRCFVGQGARHIKVKNGLFPWTASGRAIANGRDEGFTKLLFDDSPEAHGHGEIALAIEMGADAVDIGKTIHPHPTLGESIGMAAEVAHGSCTDLPPSKK